MPTVLFQLDAAFRRAIRDAFGVDADPILTVSQNEKFGDYQSNAAMGLAKQLKSKPQTVAGQIKEKLDLGEMAAEITIAGPGFINVRLSPAWLAAQLQPFASNDRLGLSRAASPQTVVVDYSGPNIAKQMHVGHLRSTIIGDAIARIIEFHGDKIVRQNHIGDWGTQFGRVVLAMWYAAVFERSGNHATFNKFIEHQRETSKKDAGALTAMVIELGSWHQRFVTEDPDGIIYFMPFLEENKLDLEELERVYQFVSAVTGTPEAEHVIIEHPLHGQHTLASLPRLITTFIQNIPPAPRNKQERLAVEKARVVTLDACNEVYRRLNVQLANQDIQEEEMVRGESAYEEALPDVVRELKDKDRGIAVESQGAVVVFIDGPDKSPLIIQKSDGSYLYGTTDLAAIRYRIDELHANRIIYTHDSRQAQHFSQVFRTADKASWTRNGEVKLEYAPFGTMLGEDGKPFKSRSGDTVKLKDLLDEAEERALKVVTEKNTDLSEEQRKAIARAVGIGAVKYADLSKDRISDYVFSFDAMLSLDGNTAPYLQYAHARVKSIFRRAKERNISYAPTTVSLDSPFELALSKHIMRLNEVVDLVARELKPHHLCTYLYGLATMFSGFFENCPVLQSEEPLRSSRLLLCDVTARTLALGLDLLGIEHPEQM